MALSDPVSCLLCLDAYERPTMLRVQLRGIGGDGSREHLICQKCGGAITAEYLYLNEAKKPEATIVRQDHGSPSGETQIMSDAHEVFDNAARDYSAEATTVVGEEKPIEVHADAREVSAKDTKRAGKSPK